MNEEYNIQRGKERSGGGGIKGKVVTESRHQFSSVQFSRSVVSDSL